MSDEFLVTWSTLKSPWNDSSYVGYLADSLQILSAVDESSAVRNSYTIVSAGRVRLINKRFAWSTALASKSRCVPLFPLRARMRTWQLPRRTACVVPARRLLREPEWLCEQRGCLPRRRAVPIAAGAAFGSSGRRKQQRGKFPAHKSPG